ncbi:PhlD [Streptomyces flavofungini]|uniref:PhlD n=1 Tax=Streptomyces flavofungini TaxID=68200 RepID=UPI0025B096A1|nr:PhlD [Streptomyces flavofungini]WJV50671.1 PhlD [Streptomyces flavofungini]
MSTALIARPHVELAKNAVSMDDLTADMARRHADLPRLAAYLRTARSTGVRTRYFSRPLRSATVAGEAAFDERNRAAYQDALEMALLAAPRAVENAGLTLADIDCVITSHTTSWTAPSLDTDLIQRLAPQGLRRDTARIPLGSYGCAGGAQALALAHDHIAAHPGAHVLVVVAECLSAATYNPVDSSRESMIYKVLFGDSAAACVVSGRDGGGEGPRFRIDDTWQYVLPRSQDFYQGRFDSYGLHFDSTREATRAIGFVAPALHEWLDRHGTAFVPDFCVVHAGGPAILRHAESALRVGTGQSEEARTGPLRHSWDSLEQCGNLGGASVLDVLCRSFDEPAPGDRGLLLGFGPGFIVAGCRLTRA